MGFKTINVLVQRAFHWSTQYHMVVRSLCIPPVNTEPHGGQIIVSSTSQHSTTWWSDHRAFHQSIQHHMVVRSSCNSTSQHSTTLWSDHRAHHKSTQHHMVVRSSCLQPVSTAPHDGQIIMHSTSQHSTTQWSDHRAYHQSTQHNNWSDHRAHHQSAQCHMVIRSSCLPPV